MALLAETDLISVGCNPVPQVAVWAPPPHVANDATFGLGVVAYGANNLVALFDPLEPEHRGVQQTLKGHTGRVNCVRALSTPVTLDEPLARTVALVSGAADKTARVWKLDSVLGIWRCSATLTGPTCPVISVGVLPGPSSTDADLIAVGSTDGTVRLYHRREVPGQWEDHTELVQTIDGGSKYALAIALARLPHSTLPILATGCTDSKIHLYVPQTTTPATDDKSVFTPFTHILALTGHGNWVRSLSFARFDGGPDNDDDDYLMLASGAQDKYIRLWKFVPYRAAFTSTATNATTDKTISDPANVYDDTAELSTEQMLEALQEALGQTGSSVKNYQLTTRLSTKAQLMVVGGSSGDSDNKDNTEALARFAVSIEAVVLGHDDWVHSVQWQPRCAINGTVVQPAGFVSTSADKSMIVWRPDPATGIWISTARVGEMGGMSTLGFFDGMFSPDGRHLLAHGATGAFHMWSAVPNTDSTDGEDGDGLETDVTWTPQFTVSGHTRAVQSLAWDPRARYLVTVSLDQTTRLFAPWQRRKVAGEAPTTQSEGSGATGELIKSWHEMARPQVHGYDLQCVAFTADYQFVSGADEKVLRAFDAPGTFVESLVAITGDTSAPLVTPSGDSIEVKGGDDSSAAVAEPSMGVAVSRPVAANLPALGLSNKAVFENDLQTAEAMTDDFLARQYSVGGRGVADTLRNALRIPPLEELRMQHTLWPETDKVYGHGYELISVAATHQTSTPPSRTPAAPIVASCCRSTTDRHAVIRLVDTRRWLEYQHPLPGHTLTVTRLTFSPDNRYLLSVSRDRSWQLSERIQDQSEETSASSSSSDGRRVREPADLSVAPYRPVQHFPKAHARIIWDAAWSPDGQYFATGSRDKTVKIWHQGPPSLNTRGDDNDQSDKHVAWTCVATLKLPEAVTAVDFGPLVQGSSQNAPTYLLAVGQEDGRITLVRSCPPKDTTEVASGPAWEIWTALDDWICPAGFVSQLAWRRTETGSDPITAAETPLQLACSSHDNSVRIFTLRLP
ncbi:Elongator subunit elp2 [Tieghemiomyces parasiticus]|uniref:Elongator complex protein 2 n=1 Tax=Tieghemiomyces parasiticus TaxID=78921 RepID=A0A9W8AAC2_9FUNG|nr:Elongator subunit elp2 [Tieghemiomyces parasiticus]